MPQEPIEVGRPVPDFALPASDGTVIRLSDFRGKPVVLYFYPKDMTPGCTQEACDFRDFHPEFRRRGAVILGISPDSVGSHGKFAARHGLPFLLLADEDHRVCEMFGVWKRKKLYGREYMGVERSTFLIGADGRLEAEWRKVQVKNHARQVLEKLPE
jgi:peroxiredoxin Q/BCP